MCNGKVRPCADFMSGTSAFPVCEGTLKCHCVCNGTVRSYVVLTASDTSRDHSWHKTS